MIRSKEDLAFYINEDAKNNAVKRINPLVNWLINRLLWGGVNPIWNFIVTLRKLEYYTNCPSHINKVRKLYTHIRFRKLSMRLGFSIPINVFGAGLSIPHYGTIVVNPNAKIGRNCRIHVGVNIGMHKGRTPIIGDNVYIGPGAIIFGDVSIGDNVSVAANATVSKSVSEKNIVIAGTPATIIKRNSQPWNYEK